MSEPTIADYQDLLAAIAEARELWVQRGADADRILIAIMPASVAGVDPAYAAQVIREDVARLAAEPTTWERLAQTVADAKAQIKAERDGGEL